MDKARDSEERQLVAFFHALKKPGSDTINGDDVRRLLLTLGMDSKSVNTAFDADIELTLGDFLVMAGESRQNRLAHREDAAAAAAAAAAALVRPQKKKKKKKKAVPAWTSAIAGGIGNSFSRTCVAPLERCRMQMIVDPGKYKSMYAMMSDVVKTEGVTGFWRGNSINVMRIAPQGAIGFFAKDYFKAELAGPGNKPTPLQTLAASMMSGICCQTGVYPLDIIRTRITTTPDLYVGTKYDLYTGVADAWKTIVRDEGYRGLFKGLYPANMFAVPYYGTQFFCYDMLKVAYTSWGIEEGQPERKINPLVALPFGSIASMTACFVAFPFQMVWKRIQTQGIGGRPILYSGPWNCMVTVIKEEGVRGVYAGLRPNLVKLAPTGALTFMAVEVVRDAMGWR